MVGTVPEFGAERQVMLGNTSFGIGPRRPIVALKLRQTACRDWGMCDWSCAWLKKTTRATKRGVRASGGGLMLGGAEQ